MKKYWTIYGWGDSSKEAFFIFDIIDIVLYEILSNTSEHFWLDIIDVMNDHTMQAEYLENLESSEKLDDYIKKPYSIKYDPVVKEFFEANMYYAVGAFI